MKQGFGNSPQHDNIKDGCFVILLKSSILQTEYQYKWLETLRATVCGLHYSFDHYT